MPVQSSYISIAESIVTLNNNLISTLSNINQLMSSSDPAVTFNITDNAGVLQTYSLPSFGYLKSEIDRLNNNVNSLYSINDVGALIQSSSANQYQKVVTVDLNVEPNDISKLDLVSNFVSNKNWFFEGLMNPELSVQLNLSGKIDINTSRILSRRYIINFLVDSSGNLTSLGQSALNSFNTLFRNNNSIDISNFENWYNTTPGIDLTYGINYDEQIYDLQPNKLRYNGVFSVLKTDTDTLNSKLWYDLDTLSYIDSTNSQINQLGVGDSLIINLPSGSINSSSTQYRILEISTSTSNPRVRLERIQGLQPIPVGLNTLKFYSPVLYTQSVNIGIGYNERCVIFVKALNTSNNILGKNWSLGTGFWTNDLNLVSTDSSNGSSMEQYYVSTVYDYGLVIKDLVAKKTPNILGATPNKVILNVVDFKVVQSNSHITNNVDTNTLKAKNNQQKSLKSKVDQLNSAISDKNKQLQITRFSSDAAKKQFQNELNSLISQKNTTQSTLSSLVSEILNLSNSVGNTSDYSYVVNGFWDIPSPIITRGTSPQEVIQFNVQYRYLSTDGKQAPINTIKLTGSNNIASFSNWIEVKSNARQQVFNPTTNSYSLASVDMSNPDVVNINQISIPITQNEQVEIRVQSISEVGWPESPLVSDWSDSIIVTFPNDLKNTTNQTGAIITDANKQDIMSSVQSNLAAQGLDEHLSEQTIINNKEYFHNASSIISGFKDSNGVTLDLYSYLQSLASSISALQAQINKTQGILQVIIFRNSQQYVVKNGSEISFTIECEDYLDSYISTVIQTGRVYANNIYVIKDFLLQVSNGSSTSPLGLLSNITYVTPNNTDVYNPSAPQVFWVDNQDELIFSNITGQTKTQLDNQFLWQVNYDSINQTSITKLSDNISNGFIASNSNSITNILSSTEFNLGYSENSILTFVGSNNSLMDVSKWIDTTVSVSSTTKLLTTIHPVVNQLTDIVETNAAKIHSIDVGLDNAVNIPLNIYFKMNSLDPSQSGLNYQYINLNSSTTTVRHTKELKFLLENSVDNRSFEFTIKFIINRNKVVVNKTLTPVSSITTK